jgi:hypothetical protein
VSIVRVGLSETKEFSRGYDAIFGGKAKPAKKAPVKKEKATKTTKAPTKKKKPAKKA